MTEEDLDVDVRVSFVHTLDDQSHIIHGVIKNDHIFDVPTKTSNYLHIF